jgi:serine/threonine protein kinase/tetratricopeptide (TPR) repeat protein
MGVVYEALDRERGTRVALKTLRHMTADALARLKREFRAIQDLHHPNVVSLGELVSQGDQWFFTMELVEGTDLLDHVRPPADTLHELVPSSGASGDESIALAATVPFIGAAEPAQSRVDEGRLRNALRQLAEALCALHAVGLVHRDVKSSNVRIARGGRLVLLDFGLVVDAAADSAWTHHAAGTPAYMAPEQVVSARVGPEADWYAVGVLLFEALTGALPFEGPPLQMLMRKQKEEPPAPSTRAPGVPADLDALCVGLLRFDPGKRFRGADVLRVLGGGSSLAPPAGSQTQTTPFVGRASELQKLRAAYDDSRRGQPVTVIVRGESGVGKSALVRRFVSSVALDVPDVVVLAGRCYERESVPYKGFDGVVDALARVLRRMGADGGNLVPTRPAPLVKVFPVLRRVEAIAEQTRGPHLELPRVDLRERAFASLRELFTRLADRRPVIIVIDDAQWIDDDSLALLAELLRPPEAPPLLLVLTSRGDGTPSGAEEPRRTLSGALQGDVRWIELGALPLDEASTLASRLLERAGVTDSHLASWWAAQSGGHPLFIDMMTRRTDVLSLGSTSDLRLEDVLWGIVGELESMPRAILETAAVAGAPLAQDIVRRAVSAGGEEFAKAVSLLRVAHLVQTSGARGTDCLEPYHDRVRAAVLTHLDDKRRAERHRRIAVALEISGQPDPEALVLHWRGAGGVEQTAHYALLAGDRAAEALAFDRAAGFYELALAKPVLQEDERRELLIKRAKVLDLAGRGEDAARVLLKAAEGAPPLRRAELESGAATALFGSGRMVEGTDVLRRVLAVVGLRAPASTLSALFWLLIYRLRLAILCVFGFPFRERDPEEVTPEAHARVGATFAAATCFVLADVVLGTCMTARSLLTAFRLGDRWEIMRAAHLEACQRAGLGGKQGRVERALIELSKDLARRDGSVAAKRYMLGNTGLAAYLRGDWKTACESFDANTRYYQTHGHLSAWITTVWVFDCWALNFLGEHRKLAQRHAELLADADRRGDLYTSVELRDGSLAIVWLAADDPEGARRNAREAHAVWPRDRYLLQHWHRLYGEAEIELYVGDGAKAYARVKQDDRALKKSLLLHVQHMRVQTAFLRGRCAIAALEAEPALWGARLAEAKRLARRLEKEGMAWSAPFAAILKAAVANAQGNRPSAVASLRAAIERAREANMGGYVSAARYQLGSLLGGEEGAALVLEAERAMTEQGIRVPARFAATLVPGTWRSEGH